MFSLTGLESPTKKAQVIMPAPKQVKTLADVPADQQAQIKAHMETVLSKAPGSITPAQIAAFLQLIMMIMALLNPPAPAPAP
jgi:hypothetical protein